MLPSSTLGKFEPGTGCDPDNFNEATFNPGWKWGKTEDIDWAKLPPGESNRSGQHYEPSWFTDVDGDGLIDRFVSTGVPLGDFEEAYVEFTQRYGKSYFSQDGSAVQLPFVPDFNQLPHSLAPRGGKWQRGTKFFYVDINGDGLVDLVTSNPNDSGGIPRVRPGNGHGEFTCIGSLQPWPCQELPTEVSALYEIEAIGSRLPWPFTEETFFHDVTGDGLADIVQYDMAVGEVRLWINQDGLRFACARDCVVGKVLNSQAEKQGLTEATAWNIGDHRTTFADMDADGIDDIVILSKHGVYVGTFMRKYVPVYGFERGRASRPGLLIRIHNGYGATTDIRYQTIQELDLMAEKDPATAWLYHSPVVANVVTQIVTQDDYHAGGNLNAQTISAPYLFKRKAQFVYMNPAYDRWSRSFTGFRTVVARYGDENTTTATTYWFGKCQNNRFNARLPQSPNIPLCPEGSEDDDEKSRSGRVVRIDRGNAFLSAFPIDYGTLSHNYPRGEGPTLLWTKTFLYSVTPLFTRPDRRVTFGYPQQIDTYLYDDAQPTQPGEITPSTAGEDPKEGAPHQKNIRKHLRRLVEYDNRGTLKRITNMGAITDTDSNSSDVDDATTITLFGIVQMSVEIF